MRALILLLCLAACGGELPDDRSPYTAQVSWDGHPCVGTEIEESWLEGDTLCQRDDCGAVSCSKSCAVEQEDGTIKWLPCTQE